MLGNQSVKNSRSTKIMAGLRFTNNGTVALVTSENLLKLNAVSPIDTIKI